MFPISGLTAPSNIVNFENLPIRGVANNRGNDFVVAGYSNSASDLFILNGTTLQPVKSNMEGNTRLRGFNGTIATRFDDVYL